MFYENRLQLLRFQDASKIFEGVDERKEHETVKDTRRLSRNPDCEFIKFV